MTEEYVMVRADILKKLEDFAALLEGEDRLTLFQLLESLYPFENAPKNRQGSQKRNRKGASKLPYWS